MVNTIEQLLAEERTAERECARLRSQEATERVSFLNAALVSLLLHAISVPAVHATLAFFRTFWIPDS
jgi:hypothetical protein